MIKLDNGMTLYHGSYCEVSKPDLSKCAKDKDFDIIGGKIADDMTNITLVTYINGAFGEVGSDEADSLCIGRLLPERLKDQFCFRSDKALSALEFVQGEKIWLNK